MFVTGDLVEKCTAILYVEFPPEFSAARKIIKNFADNFQGVTGDKVSKSIWEKKPHANAYFLRVQDPKFVEDVLLWAGSSLSVKNQDPRIWGFFSPNCFTIWQGKVSIFSAVSPLQDCPSQIRDRSFLQLKIEFDEADASIMEFSNYCALLQAYEIPFFPTYLTLGDFLATNYEFVAQVQGLSYIRWNCMLNLEKTTVDSSEFWHSELAQQLHNQIFMFVGHYASYRNLWPTSTYSVKNSQKTCLTYAFNGKAQEAMLRFLVTASARQMFYLDATRQHGVVLKASPHTVPAVAQSDSFGGSEFYFHRAQSPFQKVSWHAFVANLQQVGLCMVRRRWRWIKMRKKKRR